MNPQVSVITLGVKSIDRAKTFYGDGLGCPIQQDHGEFVSFSLGDGGSELALYRWDALADDAGVAADGSGFRGFTLSCVVDSIERVDEMLAEAERAGGTIAKPVRGSFWGYSGYFTDAEGNLWKVATTKRIARLMKRLFS